MWNLSFTACSFSLRRKHSRVKIINLNDSTANNGLHCGQYSNVMEVFKDFFCRNKPISDDTDSQRLFSCSLIDNLCGEDDKSHFIFGKISSGRYGIEYPIYDRKTKKEVYRQKTTDAPMMEFYVLIVIPKDTDSIQVQKGMIFFQNVGQFGVKTETIERFRTFFDERLKCSLWSGNISPDAFLRTIFKKENVTKLYLIKNSVSTDSSDRLSSLGYGKEERTLTKLSLHESFLTKIKSFLMGGCRTFEFENKEYEELKVEVFYGGRNRKISINNINNLSIIEDLPNDLRDSITNKIDEKRLQIILLSNAYEYMKEMSFRVIQ